MKQFKLFRVGKRIAIFALVFCVLGVATLTGLQIVFAHMADGDTAKVGWRTLAVQHPSACSSVGSDPRSRAGDAEYMFVGIVNSLDKTIYPEEAFGPKTIYTVTVLENLKGELQTETPIELWKDGGMDSLGLVAFVYENDVLPEVGKTYLFNANATPDGVLYCSAPGSNIPIDDVNAVLDKKSKELSAGEQKMRTALKKFSGKKKAAKTIQNDPEAIEVIAEAASETAVVEAFRNALEDPLVESWVAHYTAKYDVSDTEHEVGEAYYVTPQPS